MRGCKCFLSTGLNTSKVAYSERIPYALRMQPDLTGKFETS